MRRPAYEVFLGECKLPVDRNKVAKHKVTLKTLTKKLNERPDVVAFNMMLQLLEASAEGEIPCGHSEDIRTFKVTVAQLKTFLKLSEGLADDEELKFTGKSEPADLNGLRLCEEEAVPNA